MQHLICLLVLYALILCTVLSTNDNFRCPVNSERLLREKAICDLRANQSYVCLFDDNNKYFKEVCPEQPEYLAPGFKYVWRGGFDGSPCEDSRFQPFKFWTFSGNDCVLLKSKCWEEGQIFYSFGSTTLDISCQCDYSKGYAFVTVPVNYCFCDPSAEDCSCYRKACNNNYILSPDYRCIPTNSLQNQIRCSVNTKRRSLPTHPTPSNAKITIQDLQKDIQRGPPNNSKARLVVLLGCVILLTGALLKAVVPKIRQKCYGNSLIRTSKKLVKKVLCADVLIVVGEPKSGKSTLVHEVTWILHTDHKFGTFSYEDIYEVGNNLKNRWEKNSLVFESLFDDCVDEKDSKKIVAKWTTIYEQVKQGHNGKDKIIITCRPMHFKYRPDENKRFSVITYNTNKLLGEGPSKMKERN